MTRAAGFGAFAIRGVGGETLDDFERALHCFDRFEKRYLVERFDDGVTAARAAKRTDDAGVAVADVEFKLYATVGSQIVDDERFEVDYLLKEGSTLTTAPEGGETLYVVAEGQGYKLKTAKGEDYARTTGLYLETAKGVFEEVKLSTRANVEQNVEMTKIVFDESLAGQALTVDESQAAIVFANGGIIDATNLKGELTFDASTGALQISGTDLVSLIGVKITGATGSAIIVDEGAKFELANSLISGCDAGAEAVVSNAGWLSFVNVTFANCASESAMIANAGTLEIANSLFALNDGALVDGAYELADSNVDAGAEDAGFVDAANGDYRLAAFDALPVDRGSNVATRLACGLVLDFGGIQITSIATALIIGILTNVLMKSKKDKKAE